MNTRKNDAKRTLQLASAMLTSFCTTALLAHSARAADLADEPRREVVKFADLNLSSIDGPTVLYRRIHAAAIQVCGATNPRELARVAAAKTCIDNAVTAALAAVNNPLVTNRYLARTDRAALHLAAQMP